MISICNKLMVKTLNNYLSLHKNMFKYLENADVVIYFCKVILVLLYLIIYP